MPPEQLQQMGVDPNAPAQDPKTGQPIIQNPVGTLDVDIILDKSPDTVTLQQEQFEVLSQIPGIPPDILLKVSSLPNKEKVLDRITGKTGPGGQPAQPPPPPPEVIKAQADAAEKEKDREFQANKAVGDREIEQQKLEAQKAKDERQYEIDRMKLALEAR